MVLLFGAVTLAACSYALLVLTSSRREIAAVCLFLLLSLSFVSGIFLIAPTDWMTAVASKFPLQPFVALLLWSLDPRGAAVPWLSVVTMTGWLLVASFVAVRRFRWEPSAGRGIALSARETPAATAATRAKDRRDRRLLRLIRPRISGPK